MGFIEPEARQKAPFRPYIDHHIPNPATGFCTQHWAACKTPVVTEAVFTVQVGFTTQRPIIPDQFTRNVVCAGSTSVQAALSAAQIVGSHDDVVMVTSTEILDWED